MEVLVLFWDILGVFEYLRGIWDGCPRYPHLYTHRAPAVKLTVGRRITPWQA